MRVLDEMSNLEMIRLAKLSLFLVHMLIWGSEFFFTGAPSPHSYCSEGHPAMLGNGLHILISHSISCYSLTLAQHKERETERERDRYRGRGRERER